MSSRKTYRPWAPRQTFLLPPSPDEWLPDGHLAFFLLDLIDQLDLSAIEGTIAAKDPRGVRPYHPQMMVTLLLYGYALGVVSSRKLVRATYEDVAFRVISGGEHPHFTTICEFRRTHLEALEGLFVQVLQLCQKAGLVELGHVSIDGTKMKANASKHRAMSHERMLADRERLEREVKELLRRAEEADAEEDERFGPGEDIHDLPEELRHREGRLKKIREALAGLEAEAKAARAAQLREQAEGHRETAEEHEDPVVRKRAATNAAKRDASAEELEDDDQGSLFVEADATDTPLPVHRVPTTRAGEPKPKAQRNFTDPDSRIMEHQGGFVQAYNAQAAVDASHQIIVAQALTNQAPDTYHLVPLLERVERDCGELPEKATADAGYWAPSNAAWCEEHDVDAYISTGRMKRGWARAGPAAEGPADPEASPREQMRHKLQTETGRATYALRKCLPEPVFGQIKGARGLRQFLHRGLRKVRWEWAMYCTGHNILKLFAAHSRMPAAG